MNNSLSLIQRIVDHPDSVSTLTEQEIHSCLQKVQPILQKEKALIELKGKIAFIGDTHGDFETTKAVIKRFLHCDSIVFLGDYIDRELMKWGSLFNMTYLLVMKCRYPKKIILLKGNHESNYIIPCIPYEFKYEIIQKFGSFQLHENFEDIFTQMPLMIKSNGVVAAHGGFPQETPFNAIRTIDKSERTTLQAIVWSDPSIGLTFRGVGNPFSEQELIDFLDQAKATVFVRGHTYECLGYSLYGDRCLTLFTSQRYKDMGNGGVLVAVSDGRVSSVSDLIIEDFSTGKWMPYSVARR